MSVITALTSQNTTGVSDIHVIPTGFVESQIKDVVTDIPPKCIKTGIDTSAGQLTVMLIIGMLASQEIIQVVAAAVKGSSIPVVVDPVTSPDQCDKVNGRSWCLLRGQHSFRRMQRKLT